MFHERLRISPSNADMMFLEALEKEGLTKIGGFRFDDYIWLPVTRPEGQWRNFQVCTYLDGEPVHAKEKQRAKDEFIDAVLTHCGWTPLRFPYRPPLSTRHLVEIISQVKGALKERERALGEKGGF